jgi:hypothetical protein
MPTIREKIAATKAPQRKRKPVQVNSQAAAEAVKRHWRMEDAVRDVNARTMALANVVETIPGAAEAVAQEERRKALAPEWAEDPESTLFFLHLLTTGLFGMNVANAVLKIASGADHMLEDIKPDLQREAIGQFLRLVMPSLYSRREPLDDKSADAVLKAYKAERLSEDETQALHDRLWHETGYFAGWNIADIAPAAISAGVSKLCWGTTRDAPKGAETFEQLDWDAPWRVDDFLFSGLTRATVGDWENPCPVGLVELEAILDHAGDDFGPRQFVLELGAFNRKKLAAGDPVSFASVPAASTLKMGAES